MMSAGELFGARPRPRARIRVSSSLLAQMQQYTKARLA